MYGPLLEKYIIQKFNFTKNKADDCSGDCTKNGINYEIKVSLGGAHHNKFNYVQIRPSQNCDMYILTAYHLSSGNVDTLGELYIFRISKNDIKNIILLYGGYAHRTVKELGIITLESINNANDKKEYAIRSNISDKCWNVLLQYRIDELDL